MSVCTAQSDIVFVIAGAQKRLHEVWAQLETAKREAYARKEELAVTQVPYSCDLGRTTCFHSQKDLSSHLIELWDLTCRANGQ